MIIELKKFPAYLINSNVNYIEKIHDSDKLRIASLLTVKSKSLIDCFILDGDHRLFKIFEVRIIGDFKRKRWFDFIFGNPTKEIEVHVNELVDADLIMKCEGLLKYVENIDAYSIEHEE